MGGGFGMDRYTLLYLKWITNKDLLYSTRSSAQCYVAAWMRGEFGGECLHIYVWLSSIATHLKLSQHYLSAIQFSSVAQWCPLRPHGLHAARLYCSWGFSRQEDWSGLPCPPPRDLPSPGIETRSPALQADSFFFFRFFFFL